MLRVSPLEKPKLNRMLLVIKAKTQNSKAKMFKNFKKQSVFNLSAWSFLDSRFMQSSRSIHDKPSPETPL